MLLRPWIIVRPHPAPADTTAETLPLTPAIWNPNAAASRSLLFTPAFGAYIHMLNWQSLNEPEKAATAQHWFIASLVMLAVYAENGFFFPDSKPVQLATKTLAVAYLLVWYFSVARGQAKYVKDRFGNSYHRKGWWRPLAMGVLGIIGFFVAALVVGLVFGLLQLTWSAFK